MTGVEGVYAGQISILVAQRRGRSPANHFLRNKRQEWADYRNQVTPFELTRYLPML